MDKVMELNKALSKFLKSDEKDDKKALDILDALENHTMTLDILRQTKVGHTVSKLRKHTNSTIVTKSKFLVKKWKTVAGVSPRSSKDNETSTTTNKESENSISKNSKSSVKSNVQPKVPVSKKPISMSKPPVGLSSMRSNVQKKLAEIFQAYEGDAQSIATSIEQAMSNKYGIDKRNERKKEYSNKYRQLSFNLKKNQPLCEDLLNERISARELLEMSSEELATAERRKEIEKLRDDAFQKSRLDWAEANAEKINKQCGIAEDVGLFTCGRCKSTKTSNTQKQTRSADEPMTVFVCCRNCGNRWKC